MKFSIYKLLYFLFYDAKLFVARLSLFFFSLGLLIYDNETVFNVSNDYKNGISYLSFLRHT